MHFFTGVFLFCFLLLVGIHGKIFELLCYVGGIWAIAYYYGELKKKKRKSQSEKIYPSTAFKTPLAEKNSSYVAVQHVRMDGKPKNKVISKKERAQRLKQSARGRARYKSIRRGQQNKHEHTSTRY